MASKYVILTLQIFILTLNNLDFTKCENSGNLGKFREVFAWKQLTFDINGEILSQDRPTFENTGESPHSENIVFFNKDFDPKRIWGDQSFMYSTPTPTSTSRPSGGPNDFFIQYNNVPMGVERVDDRVFITIPRRRYVSQDRPTFENTGESPHSENIVFFNKDFDPKRIWGDQSFMYSTPTPTSTSRPSGGPNDFFIQYNNVPMGVERVDDRVFITIPRRRYGIPSTLNYIDLSKPRGRSPPLMPYPDLQQSASLTSVYRTRADKCGRLWMVDTGLLEIPDNREQVQQPAIVIYDLRTDKQIHRYPFKTSDIPAANTPTGLASITVDINIDCEDAYAYVPDLTTFGLIVYSLRENDSWRLTHNYFNFNPLAGNLRVAGQSFQWSDGIFSITLSVPGADGCKTAFFHPLVSTQEFSVSTCLLKDRNASADSNSWSLYSYIGDRGNDSQSTMHDYHKRSRVIFFADIGRDAVSCWRTGAPLAAENVAILARDERALSYPSDLHVTNNEVWVMANSLPRFGYSSLDTNEYNFFVYKGIVQDLIAGTVCDS